MALRFHAGRTALCVALMLAGGAQARDEIDWSLCRANSMLEFYVPEIAGIEVARESAPTDFSARSVTVSDQTTYRLDGSVVVTRADQRIAADSMRYDQTAGRVEAEGDVHYQDRALLLSADKAVSELQKDHSTLDNVRYQLLSARGNGTAVKAELLDPERTRLERVTFTTCDPGDTDWELAAREIELDQATGEGTARGMRLRFKGTTLFAFPYATFPIDDRRKSGLLYPRIGASNNGGFDLLVPYYLNLAPNYDATLTPRILTDRGLMLGGEFRYLTARHRGEIGFSYLPNDDKADRDRHSFYLDHWGQLSRNFYLVADINRVSDDRYFEDFGDSLAASATSLLPSSAYLHGRGEWWSLAFGGDDIEVTDPRIARSDEPYRRLPRLTLEVDKPIQDWLHIGAHSEFVDFDKDDAVTGTRADVHPYVAFPLEGAAWFVRPEFGVRYTNYDLDDSGDSSRSRSTTIANLDAGLFFDRATRFGGRALRQTLEPRLYYLYVPYENQDDLPIFDTQELTFGFGQLFRTNRYSGADRQMDANQLTLALSSRLIDDASGEEMLRASVGQIRFFDDQDVQLPGLPASDFDESAYVGELDLRLDDRWRLTLSQQYDPEDEQTDLSAIRAQYRFSDRGIANLAYRYRRDFLEQIDASTAFPVNERIRLIGRLNYSLRDDDVLEAFAGVEYESCCWALRVLGRHYIRSIEGDSNNALYLELELKGLGAIGRKSEDFLRQAILGYR